jgi:bifunctional NMN adenylyltransferase/nudix hydrolase
MKPNYGVVVGRFQVNDLHDGHMELFRQVSARHNGAVIVFVGKNQCGLNQTDPLDFPVRRAMIQAKFPNFIVMPLTDKRTDEEWSHDLDAAIDAVTSGAASVTLYGGRDSFVPHYKGKFTPVELALSVESQRVSGTDIRNALSNKVFESPEFRAGMIYFSTHRWPDNVSCVDVAIFNDDYTKVLLGQKPGEESVGWRFIGGHYEKKDGDYDACAKKEVMEETGLDLVTLEYVGTANIADWRYASPDQFVTTVFYRGRAMTSLARAKDDIKNAQWFDWAGLQAGAFIPEHRVLYEMLQARMNKEKVNAASTKA